MERSVTGPDRVISGGLGARNRRALPTARRRARRHDDVVRAAEDRYFRRPALVSLCCLLPSACRHWMFVAARSCGTKGALLRPQHPADHESPFSLIDCIDLNGQFTCWALGLAQPEVAGMPLIGGHANVRTSCGRAMRLVEGLTRSDDNMNVNVRNSTYHDRVHEYQF